MQLLERPPHALHKVLVHGAVRALEINPSANAVNVAFPTFAIRNHALAGFGDVFLQRNRRQLVAIFIKRGFCVGGRNDLPAVGDVQLLFNKVLSRQPMTIPTPHALDALAFHGPVARHGILNDRAQ